MATVHDLTIDVTEILVGHLFVLAEIVVKNITANSQITIIEGVELGPSLGAELSTAEDEGMEHDKTEDDGLEFEVLVVLRLVIEGLVELAHRTSQVGLEILRSLVGHLNGVLKDGLGDNFLVRETRGLR